jgi:CelD/BcsL family acetyltransferase involved in cellulose biosynthesis
VSTARAASRDGNGGTDPLAVEVRPRLGSLGPAWDGLVDQSPLPSPYLRSWWLEGVAGPDPCFVLVFAGPALVGGLALDADRRFGITRLAAIGTPLGADHVDLVAAAEHEQDVVAALAGWCGRPGSRFFDLTGVTAGARVAEALPGPVRQTQFDVAPWRTLDRVWLDQLEEGDLRHLLARPRRRLRREGVDHRVVDPADAAEGLERLHQLHTAQWGERSEFLPVFHLFQRAAPAGLERGELVLFELVADDEVIASQAWFVVAGRASYAQGARSLDRQWRGAGTVLMAYAVEEAAALGCTELDLLRGDDDYKRLWTDRSRALFRLEAGTGLFGKAAWRGLPLARRARDRLRRRPGAPGTLEERREDAT